jgi:hypothetical protein
MSDSEPNYSGGRNDLAGVADARLSLADGAGTPCRAPPVLPMAPQPPDA